MQTVTTNGIRMKLKKHIYERMSNKLLRVEEAEPVCAEDFCDRCGDCLACYGAEPCIGNEPEHYWVEFVEPVKPEPKEEVHVSDIRTPAKDA
jgi:hypothetical protein